MASGTVDGELAGGRRGLLRSQPGAARPAARRRRAAPTPTALRRARRAPPSVVAAANTRRYPARKGHDQFYGYGRVNMNKAGGRARRRARSRPRWRSRSPATGRTRSTPRARRSTVRGAGVDARGDGYTCERLRGAGLVPEQRATTDSAGRLREPCRRPGCDGTTERTRPVDGLLATVDVAELKALLPAGRRRLHRPRARHRPPADLERPPEHRAVRVHGARSWRRANVGEPGHRRGPPQRVPAPRPGPARRLPEEAAEPTAASSPLLVDLDGDNRNELVRRHQRRRGARVRRDGSELPGWPVRSDPLPMHPGGRVRRELDATPRGAILASPAAGDLDRDGAPEVVAADMEGKVYVWNAARRAACFERESNIECSGKPLTPFVDVRDGRTYRTQHGFIGSPVLADLDGNDGGRLEIVAAGDGPPRLRVEPRRAAGGRVSRCWSWTAPRWRLDRPARRTTRVDFKADVGRGAQPGRDRRHARGGRPRRRRRKPGDRGRARTRSTRRGRGRRARRSPSTTTSRLSTPVDRPARARPTAACTRSSPRATDGPQRRRPVRDRLALKVGVPAGRDPAGGRRGRHGPPGDRPRSTCPRGGEGAKVGASPAAGPAYVFNAGRQLVLRRGERQGQRPLETENSSSVRGQADTARDTGRRAADLRRPGRPGPSCFAPAAGVIRALDAARQRVPEGGQDYIAAWDAETGQFRPGYPAGR